MADQTCPVCELPCDRLVVDAPGTPQEAEMCERCQAVTEIIAADLHFPHGSRYDHPGGSDEDLREELPEFMRRMHWLLLR